MDIFEKSPSDDLQDLESELEECRRFVQDRRREIYFNYFEGDSTDIDFEFADMRGGDEEKQSGCAEVLREIVPRLRDFLSTYRTYLV